MTHEGRDMTQSQVYWWDTPVYEKIWLKNQKFLSIKLFIEISIFLQTDDSLLAISDCIIIVVTFAYIFHTLNVTTIMGQKY